MKFTPAAEWQSSWFQGETTVSYETLVKVFGPEHSVGDGYKVQAQWSLTFEDGTYATIYDWKEGDSYNGEGEGIPKEQVTCWHIGGTEALAVEYVVEAIASYTKQPVATDYCI